MSDGDFSAGMLAWRRELEARHPDISAATRAELAKWLQSQRQEPADVSKPLLVTVLHLSCLNDVEAHVGLAQMLAFDQLRCHLLLTFPTGAATLIARAQIRRNGWDGLVTVVARGDCEALIDRLPGDTALLCFEAPAILGRELIENQLAQRHYAELAAPVPGEADSAEAYLLGSAYLGRAKDYAAWRAGKDEPDWAALVASLKDLSATAPDLGISPTPPQPAKRRAWPSAGGGLLGSALAGDELQLSNVGIGDELIVRMSREPFHSDTIVRRPARLLSAGEPFAIRLPGAMLGPAPKIVRVEAHKADAKVLGDRVLVHVRPSELEPWMVSCFLNRGGGGNPAVRAFAKSIGARLAYAEDEPEPLCDIPVVWGVLRESDRILAQAKAQSLYWFYIDHAYIDRGHRRSYRITRNGYEAGAVRRCPTDRIEELGVEIQPWRKSGREIIVCPPTDYFMQAHGCSDWLETTLEALKTFTDRPVIVREKPKPGAEAVALPKAMETAHALVTHSSNVAVEAVCLGTPVFVAPTSAAAPVGRTDLSLIEQPAYPDRDPWLAHLAYNQYSFEEIGNGRAWKMLLELEERELA